MEVIFIQQIQLGRLRLGLEPRLPDSLFGALSTLYTAEAPLLTILHHPCEDLASTLGITNACV